MKLNEWVEVYQDLGFCCFPLKYRSKEPAVSSWKRFQVQKYEGDFKEGQNIAVVTGKVSNLVVIDLDDKALTYIFKDWQGFLHNTLVVETSRGYHIYCKPRGEFPASAKLQDAQGRGIDIKAEGGYVVAPPSTHPDGGKYKVISYSHQVNEIDLDLLIKKLNKEYDFTGGLKKAKLTDVLEGNVGEGARNDSAYVTSRYYLNPSEGALEEKKAWKKILEWNESNNPPLEEDELETIFDSAKNIPFEDNPEEFDLKRFKRNYVARHITQTLHPKTLRENEEIYVYKNGLYVEGGETHIKEMLHRLYYGIPRNEVNELLATVRATTYVVNDDFDKYPELIHLKNCILNVKNMKVFDQSYEFLTRNQIQTAYTPGLQCPLTLKFLSEIMPDGKDLKTLIELLASILLYKAKLEKAIIFVGDQANGKSTLIELLVTILGDQNVSNVALQRLATNRFATSTMVGKILNAYGDLDIDSIEQTGMIKQVISHDHIMIEKKNRDAFSSKIPIRLLYSANRLPEFPNADEAIFRRFWVIKFPIVIPREKRDMKLLDKLCTAKEKSGFLNILLANAHQLVKNDFRFTHYQDLEKTKSLWREKSDSVSAFVEGEVLRNPSSIIPSVKVYEYYKRWCLENTEKILSDRLFFAKLEGLGPFTKGFGKIDNKSTRVIRGLTTKTLVQIENNERGNTTLQSS